MGGMNTSSNRGQQSSISESDSFGRSGGMSSTSGGSQGFGQSGSSQVSGSQSMGAGSALSTQDIWGPQGDALRGLYGQAQGLMQGQGPAGAMNQIGQQGAQAWGQALQPGGNPWFDANVNAAIDQATSGFTRGVLPELESRGVGAGAYGTSRDQLARGEAAGQFGQGLSQQVAGMRSQQYGIDQALRGQALGMTGAMQQAQAAPLGMAQGLIGGPTVLGQSSSQNTQSGSSFGSGGSQSTSGQSAWNRGNSVNWADAASRARGSSAGSSRGDSFGLNVMSKGG
jgi:hypothetical protein